MASLQGVVSLTPGRANMLRTRPPTYRQAATVLILSVILGPTPLAGQEKEVGFRKGDSVSIALPTHAFAEATQWYRQLDIWVRTGDQGTEVFDPSTGEWRSDWPLAGFPPSIPFHVQKVKHVHKNRGGEKYARGKKHIEVTLDLPGSRTDYRFFAPENDSQAIRDVLITTTNADSIVRASYDLLGDHFFVGPLATFTPSERTILLGFAHITANGITIHSETFKGREYVVISLPGNGSTYNDLKVTQSWRVATTINEQLALLKGYAAVSLPHGVFGGIKLEQPVSHGTAPEYDDVATDVIEGYFPLEAVMQFAEFDITSQGLVEKSIILVNGNRVEVYFGEL